jgi:hypothetical protein
MRQTPGQEDHRALEDALALEAPDQGRALDHAAP